MGESASDWERDFGWRLALILILAAVALTGCAGDPPSAHDPRDGRVTISYSDCAFGSCIYDWKICVGPDLHMHIDGDDTVVAGSPECRALPTEGQS